MRVLAIGDIHGCSKALDTILAAVQLRPDDQIITLGDYIDRGPDSMGVIERLLALRRLNQVTCLRGNHEQMMLEARKGEPEKDEWLKWGGMGALASYSAWGEEGSLADVPEQHWEFLEDGCVDWYENDTHIFVHACVDPDLPLAEQSTSMLHWEPLRHALPHYSGKTVICGHTAQRSGKPLNLGHTICIDTWVYGEGCLTCLEVTSGDIWQANQLGQLRQGSIHDYRV